jgi:hypothetical protein
MRDPIWERLECATWGRGDVQGLALFWQGCLIWCLLVLFLLVNLFIPVLLGVRSFRKSILDRN